MLNLTLGLKALKGDTCECIVDAWDLNPELALGERLAGCVGIKCRDISSLAQCVRTAPDTLPAWAIDPSGCRSLSMQSLSDLFPHLSTPLLEPSNVTHSKAPFLPAIKAVPTLSQANFLGFCWLARHGLKAQYVHARVTWHIRRGSLLTRQLHLKLSCPHQRREMLNSQEWGTPRNTLLGFSHLWLPHLIGFSLAQMPGL